MGLIGGFTRSYLEKKAYFKPKEDLYVFRVLLIFGILSGIMTFLYDIFSTLVGGFIVSFKFEYFLARYLSGIVFTIIHPIGNVLGFIFILPVLIQLVYKMLY